MIRVCATAVFLACMSCATFADEAAQKAAAAKSAAVSEEDGKVDWYTYSGFRRYHAECHVCHGPEGLGSTYAPSLVESLRRMDYTDFLDVVTNGRQQISEAQQSVMPAFGINVNVMCYIDDIYVYLRARADGKLPPGRPKKREDKNPAVTEAENACLGS